MRNNIDNKIKAIMQTISTLPYFNLSDLMPYSQDRHYLKIMLARYEKRGKIVRLKKGLYVSQKYIDETQKKNYYSTYLEFIANHLIAPSYLSLDYILALHNMITEMPNNFTLMTLSKTKAQTNALGNFFYHSVKPKLFCGFTEADEYDFTVAKATKAKALFDYLYLRKNSLYCRSAVEELRLNLDNLSRLDWRELKKYCVLSGIKTMPAIYELLLKIK